jgi:hypothetical protein
MTGVGFTVNLSGYKLLSIKKDKKESTGGSRKGEGATHWVTGYRHAGTLYLTAAAAVYVCCATLYAAQHAKQAGLRREFFASKLGAWGFQMAWLAASATVCAVSLPAACYATILLQSTHKCMHG